MPETMAQQVESRVVRVEQALNEAMNDLNGRFWKSEQVENALSALKSLQPLIRTWAYEGRNAVYDGAKIKRKGGWPGWIRAGEVYLRGIDDVHDIGDTALDDIDETIEKAPETTRRAMKKATDKVAKVAKEAAKGASLSVWESVLKPSLPVIMIGVGVAVAVNVITKQVSK